MIAERQYKDLKLTAQTTLCKFADRSYNIAIAVHFCSGNFSFSTLSSPILLLENDLFVFVIPI